jgi:hypothetical protein
MTAAKVLYHWWPDADCLEEVEGIQESAPSSFQKIEFDNGQFQRILLLPLVLSNLKNPVSSFTDVAT